MRVDDDAYHYRVAGGADHDGADEGADARLVGADRVFGRLVVSSDDALRCVAAGLRCGGCVVIERRRDGDADGVREKRRDSDEEQDVTRTVTLRSDHDSG